MPILRKWKTRIWRESPAGLLFTIFSVTISVALLAAILLIYRGVSISAGTDNDGMLRYLVPSLCLVILLCSCVNLYITFSVSVEGNGAPYRLFRSVGATQRQLVNHLLEEVAVIDLVSAAVGCPLGCFIAGLLSRQYQEQNTALVLDKPYLALLYALPELLLVPVVCVIAAHRRFLPAKEKKRFHKRNMKTSEKVPGLFKKLFGTGGLLEYRIARHDRQDRNIFQAALIIELVLLLLLSGLFFIFSQSKITVENRDISIHYWAANNNDALIRTVTDTLAREQADGSIQSMISYHDYDCMRTICLFDSDIVTQEYIQAVRSADSSDPPRDWMYICCDFGESGQLVCFAMDFVDDETFQRLAKDCGAECGPGDALLYNFSSVVLAGAEARVPVLRCAPGEIILYNNPAEPDQRGYALHTVCFFGDGFDAVKFLNDELPSCTQAKVNIVGLIDSPGIVDAAGLPEMSHPTLILSQKDEAKYADFLSDVLFIGMEKIVAEDHRGFSERLLEQVKQCGNYDIRNRKFGTGTQIFGMSMNQGASGFYQQTDNAQVREDYQTFQRMFRSFFVCFYLLHACILLANIINIVYLNQRKRRKENAVLISLGLSERQQNGMRLCESAIYSFRSALFSFLIASVLYIPVYLFLMKGMLWEGFSAPGSNLYDLNTPETVAYVMTHVLQIIGLSAGVVAVVTAVVFLLFLAANRIRQKKSDNAELIKLLKDDANE